MMSNTEEQGRTRGAISGLTNEKFASDKSSRCAAYLMEDAD
jgi:hypothetical protein